MGDLRRTVLTIMLLGDGQVGTTSLILKLTGNAFNDSQLTTVGKESYIYQVKLHGYDLKMKIWDTAGQERFKSMSVQVIKNSDAVILVYAINDKNTFNALDTWISKLNDTMDISKKPIIILGNKSDLNEREVSYEEGKKYAESKGYNFYETSAKSGEHVEEEIKNKKEKLYKTFEEEKNRKKQYNAAGVAIENGKKDKKKKCC